MEDRRKKRIIELGFKIDYNEYSRYYVIGDYKLSFDQMRNLLGYYFFDVYKKYSIKGTSFKHRFFYETGFLDLASSILTILRENDEPK